MGCLIGASHSRIHKSDGEPFDHPVKGPEDLGQAILTVTCALPPEAIKLINMDSCRPLHLSSCPALDMLYLQRNGRACLLLLARGQARNDGKTPTTTNFSGAVTRFCESDVAS